MRGISCGCGLHWTSYHLDISNFFSKIMRKQRKQKKPKIIIFLVTCCSTVKTHVKIQYVRGGTCSKKKKSWVSLMLCPNKKDSDPYCLPTSQQHHVLWFVWKQTKYNATEMKILFHHFLVTIASSWHQCQRDAIDLSSCTQVILNARWKFVD